MGHVGRHFEIEAGVRDNFLDRMARMHACQDKMSVDEIEQAAIGHESDRSAWTIDVCFACARRTDEIDLRHQRAARVLGTKKDHLRYHVVEVGRAKRAWKANFRLLVVSGADEIDVAMNCEGVPGVAFAPGTKTNFSSMPISPDPARTARGGCARRSHRRWRWR